MWPDEALCALALATPPEPAREGPTSGLAPKRHKTRFEELHSAKGNWARGTNLSPDAAWLRSAAPAWFSPSPRLPIGPRRVWAASGSVGTAAWLVVSAA